MMRHPAGLVEFCSRIMFDSMCVFFSGVFNSAEAWRQCHIGHDAQGKTFYTVTSRSSHKQIHHSVRFLCSRFSSNLFSLSLSLDSSAPQTSRHAGGEESHRASAGRHLSARPHSESPQLCPLGTRDLVSAACRKFGFCLSEEMKQMSFIVKLYF